MYNIFTKSSDFPVQKQKKRYKVLLCAGGGLFGYIITYLMSQLNYDIYSKIDFAAGTSIGGILTLLYSISSDYQYINTLFKEHGKDIFHKHFLGSIKPPIYDNIQLQNFMKLILKNYTLNDLNKIRNNKLKVIIPTLDLTLTSPRVFTNIADEKDKNILNIPLTKIGLMTAAAPTYFPAMQYFWNMPLLDIKNDSKMPQYQQRYLLAIEALKRLKMYPNVKHESAIVDGGVIENIPVITTYTTLKSRLGINLEDIDMFVIGTGDDCNPSEKLISQNVNSWNIIDWLTKFIIKYVTESNETTSINWGAQMGFHSFKVFNPLDVCGKMDDPNIILNLQKKITNKIINDFKESINNFLND